MSDGGPEPEGPEPEGAGPRALPKSGLGLSALGLGTAWIGERGNPGGAAGAAATVNQALVQGLSYVDTAPHYGIGMAERRIGPALAGRPRESFAVSTKVGRVISEQAGTETFDFSPAAIRASLAGSLDRLGLAAVDVVYVHDPDFAEEEARAAAFPVLREWRRDGAVTAIGAGMNQAAMLDRFVTDPDLDLDVVLLAGRYTLLDQSGLTLLGHCHERGVGVVLGGGFNSGILADPRPGAAVRLGAPGRGQRAQRPGQPGRAGGEPGVRDDRDPGRVLGSAPVRGAARASGAGARGGLRASGAEGLPGHGVGAPGQRVGPGHLDDLAHGRFGLPVVALADGRGHPGVVGQRVLVVADRLGVDGPDRAHGDADHIVHVQQQVVLGGEEDGPVKGEVGLYEGARFVGGGPESGHGRLDLLQPGRGPCLSGQPGRARLEGDPEVGQRGDVLAADRVGEPPPEHVGVEQVPRLPGPDARARTGAGLDQALAREDLHPFAQGRAAQAELGDQLLLGGDQLARREYSPDDLPAQLVHNLPVPGPVRIRRLLSHDLPW